MTNADEIVRALRGYAKNAQENFEADSMRDFDAAADLIESLQSQLSESQRREQAAVADLMCRDHCGVCIFCKELDEECKKADYDCWTCKSETCTCQGCRSEDHWQWRGPQEAER